MTFFSNAKVSPDTTHGIVNGERTVWRGESAQGNAHRRVRPERPSRKSAPVGQKSVQPSREKYFASVVGQITGLTLLVSPE
jgi:hypothetical protein